MSETTIPPAGRENRRPGLRGGTAATVVAACAVCCAAPVMSLLGIALTGAAATAFTAAFAGVAFALVVASVTVTAIVVRRRRAAHAACPPAPAAGPVPVELGRRPDDL
jgi:hypothetical protein